MGLRRVFAEVMLSYGGNEMDFEAMWYEYTPYLYAIAGIMSILHIGSIIGISFGLVLIAGAGFIIVTRLSYRRKQSDKSERQMPASQ
jgi:Flp pilus assembly protein TadB